MKQPKRVLVVNSARNSGGPYLSVSLKRQENYSNMQYFS